MSLFFDYPSLLYEMINPRTGKFHPDSGYGPNPIRKHVQLNCANNFDVTTGRRGVPRHDSTADIGMVYTDELEGEGRSEDEAASEDEDNDDDKDRNYNLKIGSRSSGSKRNQLCEQPTRNQTSMRDF